ncbi:MAG: aldo/keto reductase [Nocardioides sp.]|uniref:aldo/keto reductase n=1 Tax=Nocardioides sp. TaxID=35761 RepID=UPI0039E41594
MEDVARTRRRLGDLEVFAIGFGAMTLTQVPGYDAARGVRVVHAALEAGITLFDTADVYGPTNGYGVNETALVEALRSWPGSLDDVVIATKGGHTRLEHDTWWIDGSAAHLRRACTDSLRRLGLDVLPLYQHHRPDPRRPYAESMQALRELYDEGLVRRVGISNASCDQIREAAAILGEALVSVQNELSPVAPCAMDEIVLCQELGLAFLAWGPLGGMRSAKGLGATGPARGFAEVAGARGVSPQRVALAWELARSPVVIPIPGASRPESVRDSVAATELVLSAEELALLDQAVG